jgi:hypothetical protein
VRRLSAGEVLQNFFGGNKDAAMPPPRLHYDPENPYTGPEGFEPQMEWRWHFEDITQVPLTGSYVTAEISRFSIGVGGWPKRFWALFPCGNSARARDVLRHLRTVKDATTTCMHTARGEGLLNVKETAMKSMEGGKDAYIALIKRKDFPFWFDFMRRSS